jgi:hypothetical protein
MRNELTENECIAIDISLKIYLDEYQEENIFKNRFPFLLEENGIDKSRINFIITELSVLKILSYKNERGDKALGHKFNRQEIETLLKNGGLTNKWLDTESKRINLKISKNVLNEYPYTKWFARLGFFFSVLLLLKELYTLFYKK